LEEQAADERSERTVRTVRTERTERTVRSSTPQPAKLWHRAFSFCLLRFG
jgi:hypothetical protein